MTETMERTVRLEPGMDHAGDQAETEAQWALIDEILEAAGLGPLD